MVYWPVLCGPGFLDDIYVYGRFVCAVCVRGPCTVMGQHY